MGDHSGNRISSSGAKGRAESRRFGGGLPRASALPLHYLTLAVQKKIAPADRMDHMSIDVADRMLMTLTFLNGQLIVHHPDMQRRRGCCDPVAGLAAEPR